MKKKRSPARCPEAMQETERLICNAEKARVQSLLSGLQRGKGKGEWGKESGREGREVEAASPKEG